MKKKIVITVLVILLVSLIAFSGIFIIFSSENKTNDSKEKTEKVEKPKEINLEEATKIINSLYKNEYNTIKIEEFDTYYEATIIITETNSVVNKFKMDKKTGLILGIEGEGEDSMSN